MSHPNLGIGKGATVPQVFFQAVLAIWPMSDQISMISSAKTALKLPNPQICPANSLLNDSPCKYDSIKLQNQDWQVHSQIGLLGTFQDYYIESQKSREISTNPKGIGPMKKSRIVMGKSWVCPGFVTGLGKSRFSRKTLGLGMK